MEKRDNREVPRMTEAEKRDRWFLDQLIQTCFRGWDDLKEDFYQIISARTDQLSADMICSIADSDEDDMIVWKLIDEHVQTYRIKNE